MYRRMQRTANSDVVALARRQAILRRLEKLMRQRAAVDGSQIWKCPKCQSVMRSDPDRQPRRGETVCSQCHQNMELQPIM
jgi:transcription elongation factor Elf1